MYVCGECVYVVNVGDVGVGDECVGVFCAWCDVCVCMCVCVCVCARACAC